MVGTDGTEFISSRFHERCKIKSSHSKRTAAEAGQKNGQMFVKKPIQLVNKYAEMGPNHKIGQVNDKLRVP